MKTLFTIYGNTPSKKNSRQVVFLGPKCKVCKRGRSVRVLPNKNYADWHKEASKQIKTQNLPQFTDHVYISMFFYRKTSHRFDYNNISQSVLDLLVDLNIIEDDDASHVTPIFLGYKKDKENPRVEIEVWN